MRVFLMILWVAIAGSVAAQTAQKVDAARLEYLTGNTDVIQSVILPASDARSANAMNVAADPAADIVACQEWTKTFNPP